jgi:multidrug transporter EmrE-like cation transporter
LNLDEELDVTILILASAFAGFGALCLSMERHARQVLGSIPSPVRRLAAAIVGWSLLLFSLAWAIRHYDTPVGITVWLGILTLAATVVGLLLAYASRSILYLAPGMLALGVVGVWLS